MSHITQTILQTMVAGLLAASLAGCADMPSTNKTSTITKDAFGTAPDGQAVDIYTLSNAKGAQARIMTYGGVVQSLSVPDKHGNFADVVLGYDNLDGYLDKKTPYFGALIGRYGNRIGGAKFTLEGQTYTLATNNGPNSLHGGLKGFDKVVWTAAPSLSVDGPVLTLTYLSKDGEEGFPGNLQVKAVYTLTEDNALKLEYTATTDKDTPLNISNHSYFNLGGAENGGIVDHALTLNADKFTPVDATLIPTGELKPVAGTVMDFRAPHTIGERLKQVGGDPIGYDHNYVLNGGGKHLDFVARVNEPTSGRIMELYSTEPGVQFYSGNFLDGTITGKKGAVYKQYHGFCLETQHFPDSINHPNFPNTVLKPGQAYTQTTIFKFSAK